MRIAWRVTAYLIAASLSSSACEEGFLTVVSAFAPPASPITRTIARDPRTGSLRRPHDAVRQPSSPRALFGAPLKVNDGGTTGTTDFEMSDSIKPLYQRKPRPEYIPGRIDDPDYVRIFDTTLRDGEQSPGATLTTQEKLEIAQMLAKLGVDIIEAGFPVASPDDFNAVQQIAITVGNNVFEDGYVPVICGLSRANEKDIQVAWDAVKGAKRPRVHTFIATARFTWKPNSTRRPIKL